MPQSVTDLEQAIRRKDMNRGQTTLLKYLYEADDWVPRDELVDEIRWGDHSSFVGVLSAFSNRVNHTPRITGDPGYEAFIERQNFDGKEKFRLREEARRAVDRVDRLTDAFEYPMEELLDSQHVPIEFEALSIRDGIEDTEADELPQWTPDTAEDELLVGYWQDVGGIIVPEVHVAGTGPSNWPDGSGSRRIDGLRFSSEYRDEITTPTSFNQAQIQDLVQDRHVEVIEVKQSLGRYVIGQAIAARELFARDYEPRTIEPVVVVGSSDPALEWVCRRNGIRAEEVSREELGDTPA